VVTALQRRAAHVRVVIAPAAVQGAQAPAELVAALQRLYACCAPLDEDPGGSAPSALPRLEGILIVRGGGSLEDLWAFNDETLVRTVAQSPVPTIAGIGHETDFSLVDFVADRRAPTPTAAAEWVTQDRQVWLSTLDMIDAKLKDAALRPIDTQHQRLDALSARLGRPSALAAKQRMRLAMLAQSMAHRTQMTLQQKRESLAREANDLGRVVPQRQAAAKLHLDHLALRLNALNPSQVLQRGYAWVSDGKGRPLTQASGATPGQILAVHLADGDLSVTVRTKPGERAEPSQLNLI
jgi:exodeoxyribonuclease VII large subunit